MIICNDHSQHPLFGCIACHRSLRRLFLVRQRSHHRSLVHRGLGDFEAPVDVLGDFEVLVVVMTSWKMQPQMIY